jgi:hypothetical protein
MGGGGGGSGFESYGTFNLPSSTTLAITVGAGGVGQSEDPNPPFNPINATAGGTTTINIVGVNSTILAATGGNPGIQNSGSTEPAGGSGYWGGGGGGTINLSQAGGAGGAGIRPEYNGQQGFGNGAAVGGSGGGVLVANGGGYGLSLSGGGGGGGQYGGAGGSADTPNYSGVAGTLGGGGGGGCGQISSTFGGNGGNGYVELIIYHG